jgi:uncharacterized membrane protein YgcG
LTIEEAPLTITRQEPALLLPEGTKSILQYPPRREQIQTLVDRQTQIVPETTTIRLQDPVDLISARSSRGGSSRSGGGSSSGGRR